MKELNRTEAELKKSIAYKKKRVVFLKKLRPLFLYLTYKLLQIFITFNRFDVSLLKQVNE